MTKFFIGNTVQVDADFKSLCDQFVDPQTIFASVRAPGGTIQTYQFGVDAEIIRVKTGTYYIRVYLGTVGQWRFRWYTTDAGFQAAVEGLAEVRESDFV